MASPSLSAPPATPWRSSIAALGIVFGDIGTSPLYAFRQCFTDVSGVTITPASVLGVLSMIFWSLALVISAKYVGLVLRADHKGEGGVLALMTLTLRERPHSYAGAIGALGLIGCALFFGDGALTPALSVLSAIEGLEIATPAFKGAVVPLSIAALLGLFAFQRHGTDRVGRVFGPVMVIWFATLAVLGARAILSRPAVLAAVSPGYAAAFVAAHSGVALAVFSAVFLAVTGGEALYADLGHFGRKPISRAWLWLVWPSLVLNYFGQGALLLERPAALQNPFYLLAPDALLVPMVALATAATIIASQSVISGVFSVTRQCQQLGVLPPSVIRYSSAENIGQVYVPSMNWILCILTLGLVLAFRSSAALSNAYGIAVSGTMAIVTVLMLVHESHSDSLPGRLRFAALCLLGVLDLAFVVANLAKVPDGGWFPLLYGAGVLFIMRTWHAGRRTISSQAARHAYAWPQFVELVSAQRPQVVPGVAVFLTADAHAIPPTLVRNVRINGILHAHTILLTIVPETVPHTSRGQRLSLKRLEYGIVRVIAHVGFMEVPNVPRLLKDAERLGLGARAGDAFYIAGKNDIVFGDGRGMSSWRKYLFLFLARNARDAAARFAVPPDRGIVVSSQVVL